MPVLLAVTSLLAGAWVIGKQTDAIQAPQSIPSGQSSSASSIDLTKLAGYAIVGGLTFYFGKKLLKA